jgi:tRNA threonylcarbamoyladenosine biosynthesis protein TsaB
VRILGVDTATWRASVGLAVDGSVVAEQSLSTAGNHAASLLPLIEEVLRRAACAARALDAVAVSSGPGSFTGLRVGVSVAKGVACATGARLIAVPTLEALARTVADRDGVICPVLDARKGELYAAAFVSRAGQLRRIAADALVTPERLLDALPTPCVVLGDAVERYGSLFQSRPGGRVTVLPFATHAPRGGVIALMGCERLQAGETADLRQLEPFYIRPSEAEARCIRE